MQHCDHCFVNWLGDNWYIYEARPGLLFLARWVHPNGVVKTCVDISQVNWDRYAEEAIRLMEENQTVR